ncbi:MAG: hypothetical protein HY865_16360 [Chloroflexi bacterium]|nr:hypothetical protein [Chloroflexota bacterium]
MDKTVFTIFLFFFGVLGITSGVVILVRKEYFSFQIKHKDFIEPATYRKVTGKEAKSDGVSGIVAGIVLLALSLAIYLWGN